MLPALLPMQNPLMDYHWGEAERLGHYFGIANPGGGPQAELWMGAHGRAPSRVKVSADETLPLDQLLQAHGAEILGPSIRDRYAGSLPFLFKVLNVASPLSLQVHPDRAQAEPGFDKENALGIGPDDDRRNYHDRNHKPELIYALTEFQALCGFRPLTDIWQLLGALEHEGLQQALAHWRADDAGSLEKLYRWLLQLDHETSALLVERALAIAPTMDENIAAVMQRLNAVYPTDRGVLMPLLLHVVSLQPGEALFLPAGVPHSYLQGVGLEAMASSDNVLRGGLTSKVLAVEELCTVLQYEGGTLDRYRVKPISDGVQLNYPAPVEDFSFALVAVSGGLDLAGQSTPEIFFCLEGEIELSHPSGCVLLRAGQSCLRRAGEDSVALSGNGRLARVSCSQIKEAA